MADSKLPCVTDMVPRIWYAVMATRPGECMKVVGTELRDQTPADLAAILTALPAPERAELLAPFADDVQLSPMGEYVRGAKAERSVWEPQLAELRSDLARETARAESSERALLDSVRHTENQRRELAKLNEAVTRETARAERLRDLSERRRLAIVHSNTYRKACPVCHCSWAGTDEVHDADCLARPGIESIDAIPPPGSAPERLANLADALADSVESMTDEQVLAEAGTPEEVQARADATKGKMLDAVKAARRDDRFRDAPFASPPTDRERREENVLRAEGWTVAVHNDYMQGGILHTFWLFTRNGMAAKGEGRTDVEALSRVRAAVDALSAAVDLPKGAHPAYTDDSVICATCGESVPPGAIVPCKCKREAKGAPVSTERRPPDVHSRLQDLVDESFGYRSTTPVERLLDVLEEEVPKLVAAQSAKSAPVGEGPRCRCIHPEEHGCRQWTDAELEDGVESQLAEAERSYLSFRVSIAAALGIDSNDPREDVLLAKVRAMAGAAPLPGSGRAELLSVEEACERGRRDGWERAIHFAGNVVASGGSATDVRALPYDPAPAAVEEDRQWMAERFRGL